MRTPDLRSASARHLAGHVATTCGVVWLVAGCLGCGSVSSPRTDESTGGQDDSAVPDVTPATIRWVRSLSSLEAFGVADGPGGLVITGSIFAPASFGGPTVLPVGGADMVIAGFDSETASHVFTAHHGDAGSEFPFLRHLDSNGVPLVHGVSYGTVDLGLGKVAGGNGTDETRADGYIGRYGPGAPAWVARIVGPGEDKITATALGTAVYGGGFFEGTTAFNNGALTSAGGRDIFLARFDFSGGATLTRTYGSTGRDELSGMAASGTGLVAAGMFDATLSFGGTAQPLTSMGALDVWVAKLDGDGNGVWATRFGGSGDDRDPGVAVDAAGDVYIAGSFSNQIAFGAVNLIAKGGGDIFVAKLRGSDGGVVWALSIGSPGNDSAGLAVDTAGHIVVGGTVGGPLDGDSSAGGTDAVIASFESRDGVMRWRKVFSTPADDRVFSSVTYGRNGDVYAMVNLGGPYDFGMPIIGSASPASVLLRIAP